ncbi:hypothetical protein BXZ70DRAFT_906781 [Cristinia sonorae]|uniref:Pentatricopeptide repeat protein n=1 Tax=Cristinia sonorae TaxID=1940300 RepID=A0A8K0UQN7_9AGAR|nr:hypothetical protein BXZ70DRAFT_906781 [Cristinia sonorae]
MASWLLPQPLIRLRLPWRCVTRPSTTLSTAVYPKYHFSTPSVSEETPFMIAIRNQPYPHVGLDLGVFEDDLEEYEATEVVYPEVAAAKGPCHVLLRLVRERNFEDAQSVYLDLKKIGVEIRPDFAYRDMAMYALKVSRTCPNEERLAEFMKWFALIPDASHKHTHHPLSRPLPYLVFSRPSIPDIPLAMDYALASASKGYYNPIRQAVALVTRYAPPSLSSTFLEQIYNLNHQYFQSISTRRRSMRRDRYYAIQNMAIRIHCSMGRLDAAVDTLRSAALRNVRITRFTAGFLLLHLQKDGDENRIHAACKLLKEVPQELGSWTTARERRIRLTSSLASRPTFLSLKNAFTEGRAPDAGLLARFFDAYKHTTGRIRGLAMLRSRAYRSPKRIKTVSSWVLAEMLNHERKRERRGVLLAFAHHFYAVGIPVRAAKFMQKLSRDPGVLNDQHPEWEPVESIVPSRYTLPVKRWPSSHHTALVWRAIVQDVESLEDVEALYQELLAHITISRNPEGVTPDDQPVPNPIRAAFDPNTLSTDPDRDRAYALPIPSPKQFDSAHFNVFLRSFAFKSEHVRAMEVFIDMCKFGIQPSVESFSIIAGALARARDLPRLWTLLGMMESSKVTSPPKYVSRQHEVVFVRPSLTTFTKIIKNLMMKEMYDPALDVVQRMKRNGVYVPGNEEVDRLLAELDSFVPPSRSEVEIKTAAEAGQIHEATYGAVIENTS